MAACNVSTLISSACANDFVTAAQDERLWRALKLQLLCNINAGGGGGGGNVEKFDSGNIALDGASMSYSSGLHGLTGVPRMVNVVLRCIGADIMAVGEESDISGWFNASQLSPAFQVKRSVTQIIVELAGNPLVGNEGDYVVGSGGGLLNPVSFNNYALRFYAWY